MADAGRRPVLLGLLACVGAALTAVDALGGSWGAAHLGVDGAGRPFALGFAVMALLALRGARGPARLPGALAWLTLAPFLADLALSLGGDDGRSRRATFVVATALLELPVLLLALRGVLTRPGPAPARRPAPLVARLALAAGATLVALGLGEGLARAAGPPGWALPQLLLPGGEAIPLSEVAMQRRFEQNGDGPRTRFKPGQYMRGWYDRPVWDYFDEDGCVDYVLNAHGFRDDAWTLDKPDGEYRVVAIGDSFTFGVGVQLDDAWTEVLQGLLSRTRGGPAQVINAGFVSGHRPPKYAPWVVDDGLSLDPDVVLIGLCLNDLHRRIKLYAYRDPHVAPWLGLDSQLLAHAQRWWRRRSAGPPERKDYTGFVRREPQSWQEVQRALLQMRDALAAAGVRYVVAIMPMVSGIDGEYAYADLQQLVIDFCRAEGIEVVDLAPRVMGRREEDLWVHPTDQHPNDVGHRLIAEGLHDHLVGAEALGPAGR